MQKTKQRYYLQQGLICFIFLYMLASLTWWYIELETQNYTMYEHARNGLTINAAAANLVIEDMYQRNHLKYMLEGITFMIFIFICWGTLAWLTYKQYQIANHQIYFLELLAHEVKTPITIGNLQLQEIIKRSRIDKNTSDTLQSSLAQFKQIDMVVNKFLVLLRLENHCKKGHIFETIQIDKLLQQVIKKMLIVYPQKAHLITLSTSQVCYAAADEALLEIVFTNLLDNACKHGLSDETIDVCIEQEKKKIAISIIDRGVGIEQDITQLFRKHYLNNKHMTDRSGIGLRISYLICKYHNGDIKYEPQPRGSKFVVTLPTI